MASRVGGGSPAWPGGEGEPEGGGKKKKKETSPLQVCASRPSGRWVGPPRTAVPMAWRAPVGTGGAVREGQEQSSKPWFTSCSIHGGHQEGARVDTMPTRPGHKGQRCPPAAGRWGGGTAATPEVGVGRQAGSWRRRVPSGRSAVPSAQPGLIGLFVYINFFFFLFPFFLFLVFLFFFRKRLCPCPWLASTTPRARPEAGYGFEGSGSPWCPFAKG